MLADIYPTYDLLEIARLARKHIHSIEGVLIWVAIPLALLPPIPVKWRWIWMRTAVITLVVWSVMVNFRLDYEVPWNEIVADIEDRNNDYDGVGGNVATLCFGWIFPFVQCIGTLTFARVILIYLGRHRIKTTEQVGAGQPATRPESNSAGGDKPQPESEGRSR